MNKSLYLIPVLIILFIFTCAFRASGQCPIDVITLTSQQEVDNFAVNYPNCTQLSSEILIGAYEEFSNITDLIPLSQIEIIGGGLSIVNNPLLTSLDGLENLFFVGADIQIGNNDALTDIAASSGIGYAKGLTVTNNALLPGLECLDNLSGLQYINIDNNPLLSSLANVVDFANLTSLNITNNPTLVDLTGLEGVVTVDIANIIGNESLADLSGLANLTNANSISINLNDALRDLNGLQNLTNLERGLRIIANQNLTSLAGLESLNAFSTAIIHENDILTDISGISNVDHTLIESLQITNNPNLSICNVESVCNYLGDGGYPEISGNAFDCASATIVYSNCSLLPSLICPFADDAILSTQEEVDWFGAQFPNCTTLNKLIIDSKNTASVINDLSPLNQINTVVGEVYIAGINVTNLTGLEGLVSIGDFFHLYTNSVLVNLQGLENLSSIGGEFLIENNDALIDLTGLENILSINDALEIIENDNLVNFNGLGNLVSIGGDFLIENNNALTDLTGLNNLASVSLDFFIKNNNALTDLTGLDNLTVPGRRLFIDNNNSLTNLAGLENLTSLSTSIYISNNNALVNLIGLENLTSIQTLSIYNNSLLNLMGLNNLAYVSGQLYIHENYNLTNLNDLENLTLIDLSLSIGDNDSLTDLSGLENLISITHISIIDNNNLQNLNALNNFEPDTLTYLKITHNPNLAVCYTQSICDYLTDGGSSKIENNDPGCDSSEEIKSSCISLPVELTHFNAETQRGGILLTWQTASETNNQGFEIQRSKDGINWEKIRYQQGAGNSNSTQDYHHNDTQPLSGINYYRLKQMDVEGDFIYSDVVSASYGNKGFEVFPVPAKDAITLRLESPQTKVGVRISNIIGEVIYTQDLQLSEGINQFTFDISEYTNGIYFLMVNIGDKNGTQRFVKH